MSTTHSSRCTSLAGRSMRLSCAAILLWGSVSRSSAQTPTVPGEANVSSAQMHLRLEKLSADLITAQERLQESQRDIQRLQDELSAIQAQLLASARTVPVPSVASTPARSPEEIVERVDILQAEVKQHEQTKVESVSKYPVRVSGLVLFNAFFNKGNVDNIDLPSISVPPTNYSSDMTTGASLRQTILGVHATGPHIFGAQSFAEVNMDFYGGIPYSNYGTAAGIVRLRTGALRLVWERDSFEAGLEGLLISPLSPTSYASVAEPLLAWAGNLWTWSPQLSYEHRFSSASTPHFALQAGLWDPPSAGYNLNALYRAPSAGERTGQPAYETRVSFAHDNTSASMQFGLGGYYSRQSYPGRGGDSWAATADWRLPVGKVFELSGEAYRGRALGGLGGGVYKDVITGVSPNTGLSTFRLLNASGGWAQAKFHLPGMLEANAVFGQDGGFASDFHSLVLPTTANNTMLRARNRMTTINLIFSPKTYLILSPEFRRITTWPIYGVGVSANIFTMSFGLRF